MVESGFFYGNFIDPILRGMREKLVAEVSAHETVIDIACGTGAQVLLLSKKVKRVVGVDLSESMIKYARKKSIEQQINNVEFAIGDATKLTHFTDKEFDVATVSLALHQFRPEIYSPILNEMKRVAKRIVIVDYAVPLPNNLAGTASKIIEFFAGVEHNRCFRKYYNAGGLEKILVQNGLVINKLKPFGSGAFYLVNCSAE
jgi:ubiquinone/menaquinone biosynthesis C-methylase UbiE